MGPLDLSCMGLLPIGLLTLIKYLYKKNIHIYMYIPPLRSVIIKELPVVNIADPFHFGGQTSSLNKIPYSAQSYPPPSTRWSWDPVSSFIITCWRETIVIRTPRPRRVETVFAILLCWSENKQARSGLARLVWPFPKKNKKKPPLFYCEFPPHGNTVQ